MPTFIPILKPKRNPWSKTECDDGGQRARKINYFEYQDTQYMGTPSNIEWRPKCLSPRSTIFSHFETSNTDERLDPIAQTGGRRSGDGFDSAVVHSS